MFSLKDAFIYFVILLIINRCFVRICALAAFIYVRRECKERKSDERESEERESGERENVERESKHKMLV